MTDKIKEVHNYFRNKLIKGDYEITKRDQYRYEVTIDGKYLFSLWMPNGATCFRTDEYSTMNIKLTLTQSTTAYNRLKKDYKTYLKDVVFEQKHKELEALQKELGIN